MIVDNFAWKSVAACQLRGRHTTTSSRTKLISITHSDPLFQVNRFSQKSKNDHCYSRESKYLTQLFQPCSISVGSFYGSSSAGVVFAAQCSGGIFSVNVVTNYQATLNMSVGFINSASNHAYRLFSAWMWALLLMLTPTL